MKNQILKKIYRAVVYLRLSDEDGDNRESDSISNQRILIHSFLKSHPEIQVVKECVDDGYTGTNILSLRLCKSRSRFFASPP